MISTYLLLTAISIVLIIAAVIIGKKLRDWKDASDLKKAEAASKEEN